VPLHIFSELLDYVAKVNNILILLKLYKTLGRRTVKCVQFMCYNYSNTIYKLPEDGPEATKHVVEL
jgi:hypothetical protein